MPEKKSIFSLIFETFSETKESFFKNPKIYAPFLVFAGIEAIALIFIYFYPRMPLHVITAPFIRTFFGEIYLHYPANFILIPKLSANLRLVLSTVAGALLTAIAINYTADYFHNKTSKFKSVFAHSAKNYVSLFLLATLIVIIFVLFGNLLEYFLKFYFRNGYRKLLFAGPRYWFGPIPIVINFFMAVLIQSFFVYAFPFILIGKEKFLPAIMKSFVFCAKRFFPTVMLVGLPMMLLIPVVVLNYQTSLLMNKFFPEITVLLTIFAIIVNSLIVDPVVTIATTLFYLKNREQNTQK